MSQETKTKEAPAEQTQEQPGVLIQATPKFIGAILEVMGKRPFKEVFQLVQVVEQTESRIFSQEFVNTIANYLANFPYEEVKPYMDLMQTELQVVDTEGNPVKGEDINITAEAPATEETSEESTEESSK